jgi:hypothetical protein
VAARCTGSALVYSGRPDPVWTITERQRAALVKWWDRLVPTEARPRAAPPLGYKGVSMVCASGMRWFAYGGVAVLTDAQGADDRRADPARSFERALIATAPRGTVPFAL